MGHFTTPVVLRRFQAEEGSVTKRKQQEATYIDASSRIPSALVNGSNSKLLVGDMAIVEFVSSPYCVYGLVHFGA